MVTALFDTNILIDYLSGRPQAKDEFGKYRHKAISIISWMEVLIGARPELEEETRAFLASLDLFVLDHAVSERAIQLRKEHRLKLPDAIIWATADVRSCLLVTRNTKDFSADAPNVRIPYVI